VMHPPSRNSEKHELKNDEKAEQDLNNYKE
jgi:hypothetical protein